MVCLFSELKWREVKKMKEAGQTISGWGSKCHNCDVVKASECALEKGDNILSLNIVKVMIT